MTPPDLATLAAAGLSDPQLADHYGVTARTVLRWRTRAGLPSSWTPTPPSHGTPARYRRGCRCKPCTAANTADARNYRRRRAIASWQRRKGPQDT